MKMRFRHEHHHYYHAPEIEAQLRRVGAHLDLILARMELMMANQAEVKQKLDALLADVADETTQIGGIEQVLNNLSSLVAQLKQDATNAQVDQEIIDKIDALGAAVGGNKKRIIDDIQKNTNDQTAPSSPPP